jgi:hypothetical protein
MPDGRPFEAAAGSHEDGTVCGFRRTRPLPQFTVDETGICRARVEAVFRGDVVRCWE